MNIQTQNAIGDGKELERPQVGLSNDIAHYSGNWIWRTVEVLVESPDFEPSPKWAARKLNVSVEKIVDAFEGLERLGYIERHGNSFCRSSPETNITPGSAKDSEGLLAIHSRLAPQIIAMLKPSSRFMTQFFICDQETLNKYIPEFMNLYDSMEREARAKGVCTIMATDLCFAIVNNENDGGGRQ